ncbi:MAG: hypothetical protein EON58_16565 [Alphaproteobacteria bacterium]|nr:MAG: hypothetical protein EON58_16565 [Alphaproteobacteria bacterium]
MTNEQITVVENEIKAHQQRLLVADDKKLMPGERKFLESKNKDILEIIRLARLGLWAEEHGIPVLKELEAIDSDPSDHPCCDAMAAEALAKLEVKE